MSERILVINPNSSLSCTAGIAAALAPFASARRGSRWCGWPDGPPAIVTWRDWLAVAEPLCRLVEREPAAGYVIACVSDPGPRSGADGDRPAGARDVPLRRGRGA